MIERDLPKLVRELIEKGEFGLTELSEAIGYSKGTASRWVNDKYPGKAEEIDRLVTDFLQKRYFGFDLAQSLTYRDSLKLTRILALLDESDNRTALVAAIARLGHGEAGD